MYTNFLSALLLGLPLIVTTLLRPGKNVSYHIESRIEANNSIEKSSNILIAGKATFNEVGLRKMLDEKTMSGFSLGNTMQGRGIDAWYFPGTSDRNALVIGGVHGSELSSVEVAEALIRQLRTHHGHSFNIIVIPVLFPDNLNKACLDPSLVGTTANVGRYTSGTSVDPNRQMPTPGMAYDEGTGVDHHGRPIELENRLLLQLIQYYKPERIVNLHSIRNIDRGGVYADPRTDHRGIALGFEPDSALAIRIAGYIAGRGGHVEGNKLTTTPTALYYKDPPTVAAGLFQPRNYMGSKLTGNRGKGISLGTWASTGVVDKNNPEKNRAAITIITVEYPGCRRPMDYEGMKEREVQEKQVDLFAEAIRQSMEEIRGE